MSISVDTGMVVSSLITPTDVDMLEAMPCILEPPPIPAFQYLSTELALNVCGRLRAESDLRALRQSCRLYKSIIALVLGSQLPAKMRHYRALITEDGLRTVLALISVPYLRDQLQFIEFLHPEVEDFRAVKLYQNEEYARRRWFGYFLLEPDHMRNLQLRVSHARSRFWSLHGL